MKNLITFAIGLNIFLLGCRDKSLINIKKEEVQRIEILNKSRDSTIANSIVLTDQKIVSNLIDIIQSSQRTIDYNIKSNTGFIEILLIDRDNKKKFMTYIYTDHGEIIFYEGNYYLNKNLKKHLRYNCKIK